MSTSLLVKDVMTKNVITLDAKARVKRAAELMDKHHIGCLVATIDGRVVGIVTERDMIKRVLLQSKDPEMTLVGDIMSSPLITSSPETELREAVRLMNERSIKKLVVLDGEGLVGLLSITDVVRSLAWLEHTISSLCSRCQRNVPPVSLSQ